MATEQIPGGLASGKPDSAFDKQALSQGIEVEMEHTKDKAIAKEIAKDHLTEDPEYYVKLKKVEKSEDPITKWKTPTGDLKKPPKNKDERKKMVSDLIRHYLKQPKEKLPGGQKQAVAIAMNQAGMSKAQPLYLDLEKAAGRKYIRREGTKGNYKYIYKDDDKSKGPVTPGMVNQAKELGASAFHAGRSSAPAQDKKLMALIGSMGKQPMGTSTPLLDAFSSGWHSENVRSSQASVGIGRDEIESGLKKDKADLAQAERDLDTLEAGGKVENLTIEGAKANIEGLKQTIRNKSRMLSKAMIAEMLGKANPGEGSRGGSIIGHTKSGKPIYEPKKAPDVSPKHYTPKGNLKASYKNAHKKEHEGWSAQDHLDAARVHNKAAQEAAKSKDDKGKQNKLDLASDHSHAASMHGHSGGFHIADGHTHPSGGSEVYHKDTGKRFVEKSLMDEMISKAKSGEGSRGGKIIGHTKSGKPIYGPPEHLGKLEDKASEAFKKDPNSSGFHQAVRAVNEAHDKHFKETSEGYTIEDHKDADRALFDHKLKHISSKKGPRGHEFSYTRMSNKHSDAAEKKKKDEVQQAREEYDRDAREMGTKKKSLMEGMMSKASGEGSRGGKVVGHTKGGNPVYAKEGSEGKEDPKKTLDGLYRQITLHHEKISKEGDPGGYYQKTIDRLSSMASDLEKKHGLNKALTASAIAIPRRPKFETIEESGSRVLTRTNSVFGNVPNTPQLLRLTPEVEKSNPVSCEVCGRTYMAKSSPNGCPTCEYRRLHAGQPGPRW